MHESWFKAEVFGGGGRCCRSEPQKGRPRLEVELARSANFAGPLALPAPVAGLPAIGQAGSSQIKDVSGQDRYADRRAEIVEPQVRRAMRFAVPRHSFRSSRGWDTSALRCVAFPFLKMNLQQHVGSGLSNILLPETPILLSCGATRPLMLLVAVQVLDACAVHKHPSIFLKLPLRLQSFRAVFLNGRLPKPI